MASPTDTYPCPVCGDPTNHAHHQAAQISCDVAILHRAASDNTSYGRAIAVTWLAKAAGIERDQAESTIAELSRAGGHVNAVRVLDILLASGWRAPERGAE